MQSRIPFQLSAGEQRAAEGVMKFSCHLHSMAAFNLVVKSPPPPRNTLSLSLPLSTSLLPSRSISFPPNHHLTLSLFLLPAHCLPVFTPLLPSPSLFPSVRASFSFCFALSHHLSPLFLCLPPSHPLSPYRSQPPTLLFSSLLPSLSLITSPQPLLSHYRPPNSLSLFLSNSLATFLLHTLSRFHFSYFPPTHSLSLSLGLPPSHPPSLCHSLSSTITLSSSLSLLFSSPLLSLSLIYSSLSLRPTNLSLAFSLAPSHPPTSLSISLSISLSPTHTLSLSLFLLLTISPFLFPSFPLSISLSPSLSFLPPDLYLLLFSSLPPTLSHSLSVFLSLTILKI